MDDDKKPDKAPIKIPRKALYGIAPATAITGVLLSKGDIGPLLLFFIGIAAGVLIGKAYFESES